MTATGPVRRVLPDASDIPALKPEKIAGTRIHASLGDLVEATGTRRLYGYEGLAEANGLALAAYRGQVRGLLCVPRSIPLRTIPTLVGKAARAPGLALCFLDYLTWFPGGLKNAVIAVLNQAINDTSGIVVRAYIIDPEGQPRIVVGGAQSRHSGAQDARPAKSHA
jgi:hypothetical protein